MAVTETAAAPRAQAAGPPPVPARGGPWRGLATALLAGLLVACGYAAFADGATGLGAEGRLDAGLAVLALVAAGAVLGTGRLLPRTSRAGWVGLALLAGFAAWCGLSLAWSLTPDLSWQETNRAVAYALVVAVALVAGTWAPRAAERAGIGLLAVACAAALYALAGKVVPGLLDGTALSPRLREPLGYWNALALLCALAQPVALRLAADRARRTPVRLAALAAVWLLLVVAGLTYSRGGALALAVAVAVVLGLGAAPLRTLAVLGLATLAAAPGLALAFSNDTLTIAGVPLDDRIGAGRELGLLLALSLAALLGAGSLLLRAERRVEWRAAWSRRVWAGLGVAAALAAASLLASGTIADGVRDFGSAQEAPSISAPSRLLSTNSGNRLAWWREAAGAWADAPLAGHGAGSFPVLHLQYRRDTLQVRQPHDVPLEFASETGLIGGLLGVGGIGALLWAAVAAARRRSRAERGMTVALTAAGAAWAVHALVDWDWDIPGVTVPALLALGVAAAWPAERPAAARPRPIVLAAVALAGWAYLVSVALPALADSRAAGALRTAQDPATSPAVLQDAASRADFGARLDPLAVRPRFAGAAIAERRGRKLEERRLLLDAVERQPTSVQAWQRLAVVALDLGDRAGAAAATRAALRLDPRGRRTRELAATAQALLAPPENSPTATGTPLAAG